MLLNKQPGKAILELLTSAIIVRAQDGVIMYESLLNAHYSQRSMHTQHIQALFAVLCRTHHLSINLAKVHIGTKVIIIIISLPR